MGNDITKIAATAGVEVYNKNLINSYTIKIYKYFYYYYYKINKKKTIINYIIVNYTIIIIYKIINLGFN